MPVLDYSTIDDDRSRLALRPRGTRWKVFRRDATVMVALFLPMLVIIGVGIFAFLQGVSDDSMSVLRAVEHFCAIFACIGGLVVVTVELIRGSTFGEWNIPSFSSHVPTLSGCRVRVVLSRISWIAVFASGLNALLLDCGWLWISPQRLCFCSLILVSCSVLSENICIYLNCRHWYEAMSKGCEVNHPAARLG